MSATAVDLGAATTAVQGIATGISDEVPTLAAAVGLIAGLFILFKAGLRLVRGQSK